MPPHFINMYFLGMETIFSLVIFILALLIYLRTQEIFSLTKHQGIKYFRNTFLFFSLAYAFRFLFVLFNVSMFTKGIFIPRHIIQPLFLVLTSYLSTMAIIFLTLSVIWKKFKKKEINLLLHLISIMIALIILLTRSPLILIILQAALLIFSLIMALKTHSKSKKFSKLIIIYVLLSLFWIVNLSFLGAKLFIPMELGILFNIISIGIFAYILHKVAKLIKW